MLGGVAAGRYVKMCEVGCWGHDAGMRLTGSLATITLAVALGALSACGGNSSPSQGEAHGGASSPAPSPTVASTSAAPKPKPTGIPTSYPAVGLEFTKLPKAHGPAQAAIKAYVAAEVSVDRTVTSLTLDPALSVLVGDDLLQQVKNNIASLKQHHQRYSGPLKIAVTRVVGASDHIVVLDTCVDASGQRLASTNGGPSQPLTGDSVGPDRIQVSLIDNRWKLTSDTVEDGPC